MSTDGKQKNPCRRKVSKPSQRVGWFLRPGGATGFSPGFQPHKRELVVLASSTSCGLHCPVRPMGIGRTPEGFSIFDIFAPTQEDEDELYEYDRGPRGTI